MAWDDDAYYETELEIPSGRYGKLLAMPGGVGPAGPVGPEGPVGSVGPVGPVGPSGTMATFASLSAFPAAGSPDNLYVAEDTNDSYRWDGTKYVRVSERVLSTGVTDSTVVGRKVIVAVDEQAARDAIVAERLRTVNVRDYGAVPDWNTTTQTGTDNSAAFAAALTAAGNGSRKVFIPAGAYRLASPLLVSQPGVRLEGDYTTQLIIDHTDGPGVHISVGYVNLQRIRIYSSTARKSAAFDTKNIGVLVEGPDTPKVYCSRTLISDVEASDQPSHGFVLTGYNVHSQYDRISAFRNKGHGIVVDGGEITGRVNVTEPGINSLRHCWAGSNGGHGLLLGNPTARVTPFRIFIDNLELTDNATDPAVRFTTDQAWLFGENCELRTSAFGASDLSYYGLHVAGRLWTVRNIRAIGVGRSVTLGGATINGTAPQANTVENIRVINTSGVPQAVGVVIETGVSVSRVHLPFTVNMTVPVQDNASKDAGNIITTLLEQYTATAALATTQNDYDWNLGKRTIRLSAPAGGATITGFLYPSSGRQFRLINVSANTITLANGSIASSFFNRITTHTGADLVLKSNESVLLEYDSSSSRWRTISAVPAGFSALGHTHVAGDVVGAEATINKNVASGYAGLDANSRIQAAQLPLGSARLVCTTASGASGAENGANTWVKLATIDPAASTNTDASLTLAVNAYQSAANSSATVSVYVRANATGNPTADLQMVSRTGTSQIAADSFKLINNGAGTPVELWMRKSGTFGQFTVTELARAVNPSITVTYSTAPGWQSATPTGTAVNVSSAGVTAGGNPVSTRVAVPGNAAATGLPGQWAADATAIYAYTGNGTTHTWVKSVAAAW